MISFPTVSNVKQLCTKDEVNFTTSSASASVRILIIGITIETNRPNGVLRVIVNHTVNKVEKIDHPKDLDHHTANFATQNQGEINHPNYPNHKSRLEHCDTNFRQLATTQTRVGQHFEKVAKRDDELAELFTKVVLEIVIVVELEIDVDKNFKQVAKLADTIAKDEKLGVVDVITVTKNIFKVVNTANTTVIFATKVHNSEEPTANFATKPDEKLEQQRNHLANN